MRASYGRIALFAAVIALTVSIVTVLYLSLIAGHVDKRWETVSFGLITVAVFYFIVIVAPKILKPAAVRPALWAGLIGLAVAVLVWVALWDSWSGAAFAVYGSVLLFSSSCLGHWWRSGGRIRLTIYEVPQDEESLDGPG